jgi:hypothetical protein
MAVECTSIIGVVMGEMNFNKRQCIRVLKKLGFFLCNKRFGRHDKFCPPPDIAQRLLSNQPKFIMIPRHNDLHCQGEIISELRVMGGDELVERFKELL